MASIKRHAKTVVKYVVEFDVDEVIAIIHVMGATSGDTKEKFGCNKLQARKGGGLYLNFINQLKQDGIKIS